MAWPSTPVPTTNLNDGSDSPAAARADLLAAVQAVNAMQTEVLPPAQGGMPTGAGMDYYGTTAPAGWVMASGRTIGNASSIATERANADCHDLFVLLWSSMADAQATVSGGRGASAEADWGANKTITLPDKRGRVSAGKDDMGGTAASRLTSGGSGVSGATLGASGGAETHTLTIPQMPSHDHNGNGYTDRNTSGSGTDQVLIKNRTANALSPAVNATGGGGAHNNTQPTLIVNYIIKL